MQGVVGAVLTARIGIVERDGAGPVVFVAVAGERKGTGKVALQAYQRAAHEDVVGLACGLAELPVAIGVQWIRVALNAKGLVVKVVLGVSIKPYRVVVDYCSACSEPALDLDVFGQVLLQALDLLGSEREARCNFRWR